jgi:hypothetical protein
VVKQALLLALALPLAAATWRAPSAEGVRVTPDADIWKVASDAERAFTLDSELEYPARAGDTFEMRVRVRVDLHTRALPELACFDVAGREIAGPSALATASSATSTDWQTYRRLFAARPGTARVRARIRAEGRGVFLLAGIEFRPLKVDPYQTGALVSQIHPRNRRGLVLESNLGIVNRERVSSEDRDGDGKWALVRVDLDELSRLEKKGEDWRTKFEYKPNEIYWSDGAVLKSDTVDRDRAPDPARALHFRMKVHKGRYTAILNDPGRAVAVSLDGRAWRRFEGGQEADVGAVDASRGFVELWVDACYRDPVSVGPVYFDYVRLYPADDRAAAERLFQAARQKPVAPARGTVEERRVEVRAEAAVFSEARRWPVRCGLPIPRGELASAAQVAVLGGFPVQSRAMARWPDGSVKWLFLDLAADFSSVPTAGFTVVYGNRVKPAPLSRGVMLARDSEGINVDTGAIRFRVPAARFGMVEQVRLPSGRAVWSGPVTAEIVEAGGRVWRASELAVSRLEIEQAGPLHAVILAETRPPAGGFAHRARIHAYAGSPLVEIDYFVANTDPRPKVMARSITLRVPAAAASSGAQVQAGEKPPFAPGWAAVPLSGGGTLHAGVAAFREQYPKSLKWSAAGLDIGLWAREGGEYEWIQGVGKTHHVALHYSDNAAGDGSLVARGPILAVASPEWYTASGAFGPIGTARASGLPQVERTFDAHMRQTVIGRVGLGFENYGDHSSGGYVAGTYLWDNNEYDLPAGCLIHFARTGDRDALRLGIESARHYLDVDTIHYSSRRADWVGAAHTHSHGDVGHHTADAPNMHHAGYVQGLILESYFTGDPDGLAGARGIAEWVLGHISPEANVGMMERALGHPLTTLTDVYEATWEERYLRGAARLVDWAIKWEHPVRGGFLAPITEQPAYYSGSPFCGGLITAALLKFNGWARDAEIDGLLERTARWLLTDMWRPGEGILSKGGSPRRSATPGNVASHMRLLRWAYERTGDPLFLAVPRELLIAGYGEGRERISTRSTGLVFNHVPHFLPLLDAQGGPAPDPGLRVTARPPVVTMAPGATARVCFQVGAPVDGWRVSFQPRLDFTVTGQAAGAKDEMCYDVRAPEAINLTSEYNRVAYAQWTAISARGTAHAFVTLKLAE